MPRTLALGLVWLLGISGACGQARRDARGPAGTAAGIPLPPLPALASLDAHNVRADTVTYRGRRAIRLVPAYPGGASPDTLPTIAVVRGVTFTSGTIELDVAGSPLPGAGDYARGFIGVSFHTQPDARRFKAFFLRPTNGRADDQLRRNHSTQYIAEPEFPWHRLRREEPGRFESYVDLEPGVWTRMKVVVSSGRAELFVNGASQPALVVSDMKLPVSSGGVALWVGSGTDGYFANLRVY